MRLTLELESSTRAQLAHQAHSIVGEDAHRIFREEIVPAVHAREPEVMLTHDRTYGLVFRVEEKLDRPFAFLGEEAAAQSAAADGTLRATARIALAFAVGATLFAVGVALSLSRSIAGRSRASARGRPASPAATSPRASRSGAPTSSPRSGRR
jgi:hypothetical protein